MTRRYCNVHGTGQVKDEQEDRILSGSQVGDRLNKQDEKIKQLERKIDASEKRYYSLANKYIDLSDKLYEKDFFEVEKATKYTESSRVFKNGLCVYNNRLDMAYSVTEIVEVLNAVTCDLRRLRIEKNKEKGGLNNG